MSLGTSALFGLSLSLAITAGASQLDLFRRGDNGVNTYRIPSLITTPKGTILAFAEARYNNANDHGHIETVLRRSTDLGRTWSAIQVVARDGTHAVQNPTAVVDRSTGVVWLMLIRSDTEKYKDDRALAKAETQFRRVWVTHSADEGATWAKPTDITTSVCPTEYRECVPGPGVGIQLRGGRLVIPAYHDVKSGGRYSDYIIYSDDHGKNWRRGGGPEGNMDECQVVELLDGSLMLNMRSNRKLGRRAISISRDQGQTWSPAVDDPTLVEPVCQGSIIRYGVPGGSRKAPLLFSNPAREKPDDRTHLTVRLSDDEGKTWRASRLVNEGSSAYSCLAVLPDGSIGCLYEGGSKNYMEQPKFARGPVCWRQR
ncbi:MAG: sialidase family protein [Acidobacteria bacterium]|nr:sialidase family protein [Acidobacteriota bacterium]